MKISTKGRYGLRAMMDLAIYSKENYISLKEIAERQNISEPYLEQLMANLKKAELVSSVRGSQGGYKLSRNAEEITIGEVLRALEGSLAPVACVVEDVDADCERFDFCVERAIWIKIRDSINAVVDSIKLSDVISDFKKEKKENSSLCEKGVIC